MASCVELLSKPFVTSDIVINQNRRKSRLQYHCDRCRDKNFLIECKCWRHCGELLTLRDNYHRVRNQIIGHSIGGLLDNKNPNWKGDDVGYDALHEWIKNRLPKSLLCRICNKVPPNELANISGNYLRDINDWQWLCYSCHRICDHKSRNKKRVCNKLCKLLISLTKIRSRLQPVKFPASQIADYSFVIPRGLEIQERLH